MEKIFYELKPFFCISLAIYALLLPEPSKFVVVCAILLLAAGALILRARLKARSNAFKKGRGLELVFYESQPYLYILIAVFAFMTQRGSKLALISSIILFVCGAIILKWRAEHRR